MNSYHEYDDHSELAIIIREHENQYGESDTDCNSELDSLVTTTTTHHDVVDEGVDNKILLKNTDRINSADIEFHLSINNENNTVGNVGVTECDDEYDTLDELFDIAKLLSDSMSNQQMMSGEQIQSKLKDNKDNDRQSTQEAFDDNSIGHCGNHPLKTTYDNLISSRNVEIKQVIIGYPDRMSIVMEESDDYDEFDSRNDDNASQTSYNQERYHQYNEVPADELSSDQQDIYQDSCHEEQVTKFFDSLNEPLRVKSGSSSTSDVTTIDENDVACEIEIHQQPLDHWVENSYATVVRHAPTTTPTTINPSNGINTNANHNTEVGDFVQVNLEVYNPHEEYSKKQLDSKLPTRESVEQPRCYACGEVVYPLEALQTIGRVYHKTCFKCHQCQRVLSLGKYSVWEGNPYCEPHYLVLFKAFGQYNSNSAKPPATTLDASVHVRQEVSKIEQRPTSNVTQALVAKFQGLESATNNTTYTQNSLSQNQLPRRIFFNPSHSLPTNANGDTFPSSGRARQLVERWNKMPQENKINGQVASELNGNSHVINPIKFTPAEPKPLVKKAVEQSRQSVNELKQNFSHKPDDEAYSSSESTESANMLHCRNNRDSKTNEFPTPGITRNLVAKFSALSAAS
ncbi:LIM domain-containing protein [Schistosoma japonicum]|uniref:LIM domain-containing protein n=2 Tax=Schistosoma japonicum TaxID=6182 RepID=A0A4Z2DLT2_SCHJA|nr:LIM domain-containing protein [Schistosoma japonicum]